MIFSTFQPYRTPGTYFTAIMFMVASSCVTTIMILNYHHRLADTHEMPDWVSAALLRCCAAGSLQHCGMIALHIEEYFISQSQVCLLFLQWLPWLLKMGRPGEKITRKTILMAKKMKDLDMKETSSKSLLSNVLDMDDDFRSSSLPRLKAGAGRHPSHCTPALHSAAILRSLGNLSSTRHQHNTRWRQLGHVLACL